MGEHAAGPCPHDARVGRARHTRFTDARSLPFEPEWDTTWSVGQPPVAPLLTGSDHAHAASKTSPPRVARAARQNVRSSHSSPPLLVTSGCISLSGPLASLVLPRRRRADTTFRPVPLGGWTATETGTPGAGA